MKTKRTIIELTHDDLVNLFSTALEGSFYLTANYTEHADLADCECFEDKLAKSLLNGRTIIVSDNYAEGETYGNLVRFKSADPTEFVSYLVTLEDVKRGLENAANGNYKTNDKYSENELSCGYNAFVDFETENMDLISADILMQIILFNEIVYG